MTASFMPYGIQCPNITSDLNTFVNTGLFRIQNTSEWHTPLSTGWSFLLSFVHNSDYIVQVAIPFTTIDIRESLYIRNKFEGTWFNWNRIICN